MSYLKKHKHAHKYRNLVHSHEHSHHISLFHKQHKHRSFILGLIHGLAGSAAFMLLVVASISSIMSGLIFILIFGVGTVFGMLLASGLIAILFLIKYKSINVEKILQTTAGSISIVIGVLLFINTLPQIV